MPRRPKHDPSQEPLFGVGTTTSTRNGVTRSIARPGQPWLDDGLTMDTPAEYLDWFIAHNPRISLQQIYKELEKAGFTDRASVPVQDRQTKLKRDARNWAQDRMGTGKLNRVSRGVYESTVKFICNFDEALEESSRNDVYRSILVINGQLCDVTISLQSMLAMFREQPELLDAVVIDPPFGLGADNNEYANHAHNTRKLFSGYVELPKGVDQEEYHTEWLVAAKDALRDGGNISIITGPDQAMYVGIAAMKAGLTQVDYTFTEHNFPIDTSRRDSPGLFVVTTVCKGDYDNPNRTFHTLPEVTISKAGNPVARAMHPTGPPEYNEHVHWPNSDPTWLLDRIFRKITDPGDLVALGCAGGFNPVIVALQHALRVVACDLAKESIRYGEGRLTRLVPQMDIARDPSPILQRPIPPDRVRDFSLGQM